VLSDYDDVLSCQVFTLYEKHVENFSSQVMIELDISKKKLQLAEFQISKLQNMPVDISLDGGKYLLYAYMCNSKCKFGTSFCNKKGERPKSHKTSFQN